MARKKSSEKCFSKKRVDAICKKSKRSKKCKEAMKKICSK